MTRRLISFVAAIALAPIAARAQVERREPPAEEWLVVSIGGQPAGYVHRLTEPVAPDRVRFTERSLLRMNRLGTTSEIRGETTSLESVDGAPLRIESLQLMSARESRTVVRFDGGLARVSTTAAGRTRETERELPAGLLGPRGLSSAIVRRLGEPGAEIEATVWLQDFGGPVEVWAKIGEREEVASPDGGSARLVRVDVEIEAAGIRSTSWYDDQGCELLTSLTVAGMEIRSRAATAAEALAVAADDAAPGADVFAGSIVVEPAFLPAPRSALRALLRVSTRDGEALPEIPTDARQRVLGPATDAARDVELRSLTPAAGAGGRRPIHDPSPEVARCLLPSATVQSDAPQIVALTREAIGDEAEAWRAACAIEAWVARHVTDKSFGVAFASALEVAEDRSGDCSEHAVLMAAMCRAAGIPSRMALGLLYVGGVWAPHAWTEVWIAGDWYALDATIGAGRVDALHLALAKPALADDESLGDYSAFLASLGRLQVDVLELTTGHSIRPAEAAGSVEDGRYVDRAFGIALGIPEGLAAEARRPRPGIGFELLRAEGELGSGQRLRLSLRAYDPDVDGGWPAPVPLDGALPCEVDGRPALRVVEREGGPLRVLVRANDMVFELKAEPSLPATADVIEGVIDSIDFDGPRRR